MKMRKAEAAYEQQKRELWIEVAIAYTRSSNSTDKSSMACWANHAVTEFTSAFPYSIEETEDSCDTQVAEILNRALNHINNSGE